MSAGSTQIDVAHLRADRGGPVDQREHIVNRVSLAGGDVRLVDVEVVKVDVASGDS